MLRIYENRTWRVRALLYGSVPFAALIVWLAFLLPPEPAPTPGERVILSAVGLLGPLAMVGLWLYARQYVTALDWDAGGERLEVETTGWVGPVRISIPIADLRVGELRGERVVAPIAVNTLWSALRVRGRRWPLIVDLVHGDVLDDDAVMALEEGCPPPGPVEPRPPTAKYRRELARRQRRRR